MHTYESIDLGYFDLAPVRLDDRITLSQPPDVVWKIFESSEAWCAFDFGVAGASWTSPPPLRPGSTRRVHLSKWIGSGTVDEIFFDWRPEEQFAFSMHRGTSSLIEAYGELWSLAGLDGGGTELRLRTALSLKGRWSNGIARSLAPILDLGFTAVLRSVKRYLDEGRRAR